MVISINYYEENIWYTPNFFFYRCNCTTTFTTDTTRRRDTSRRPPPVPVGTITLTWETPAHDPVLIKEMSAFFYLKRNNWKFFRTIWYYNQASAVSLASTFYKSIQPSLIRKKNAQADPKKIALSAKTHQVYSLEGCIDLENGWEFFANKKPLPRTRQEKKR